MSIEIRELHIKAFVGTDKSQQQTRPGTANDNQVDREALIAECVEQVMGILERKKER